MSEKLGDAGYARAQVRAVLKSIMSRRQSTSLVVTPGPLVYGVVLSFEEIQIPQTWYFAAKSPA